jgi:AcrR family transcriptional regulator
LTGSRLVGNLISIVAFNQTVRVRRQSPKADAKAKQILENASRLFDELGYHSVSVDEIANSVGIQKPTLYHYFSNKHEILFMLHEVFIDLLIEKAEARSSGLSARESLREMMADILELMHTHRGYVRVFFEHYRELPVEAQETIREKRDLYEQMVEATIQRGISEGDFRHLNSRLLALAVFGICNWSYQWYRADGPFSHRELAYFFADLLFSGLNEPQ